MLFFPSPKFGTKNEEKYLVDVSSLCRFSILVLLFQLMHFKRTMEPLEMSSSQRP